MSIWFYEELMDRKEHRLSEENGVFNFPTAKLSFYLSRIDESVNQNIIEQNCQ